MKLNMFPLLSAYCGGQCDECSGINAETWVAQDHDLPSNEAGTTTPAEAAAAEAQLAAVLYTPGGAWHAGYEAMLHADEGCGYVDPQFPLAWEISGRFF